ncbi:MAG: family 43 glycosylhydrolase, partial [Clostridiales bacterium]|nr:family 43 glycosylhydrolase [Clostridiales bacterium]
DNYLITASDIRGPWSRPVYLHSAGFDASIFHDSDGRKWVVSLEWETRDGYEKPGSICLVEYSPEKQAIIGYPKRIWNGGTDRGCIEAPHLTRHNDYYYIMCAEGGTGYNHCVTMGRSKNIWGPYESDPMNPIVTSAPGISQERHDPDHLKPKYFNPDSVLQKSGHGSYVETPDGEVYLMHLCARPFVPELRCTLGRETAIQKMKWTTDGWLRMFDGGNLAKEYVPESQLPECPMPGIPDFDDFDTDQLGIWYYSPRIMPESFADVSARPGYVRIRGQESRTSLNKVSILARKLTSVCATVTTKMEFHPEIYQHSDCLILYYDNMNYINLRKYYSNTLGQSALSLIHLENGNRNELVDTRIAVKDVPVYLRLYIRGRICWFEWSYDGLSYEKIGSNFDTTRFSDEYCSYGEFTGTFVGLTCADRMKHEHYADFDFFEYHADEDAMVN